MPMNRVQFQPGMSLREFQGRFGTRRQCRQALQEEGDAVAKEAAMGRIDSISLIILASTILLLVGVAVAPPGEPLEFASICRSCVDAVAAKAKIAPATPVMTGLKTRPDS